MAIMGSNKGAAKSATKSAGGRFLKLAGMTASITTKAVTSGIRSINANEEQKQAAKSKLYEEIGLQIAQTLGEMKGAVMKVGQMMSQVQDILPPEIAKAISALQRQAPAMPFSDIEAQIVHELGKPVNQVFKTFEQEAFAAASIGQVHRATLLDGTRVVVKVQYPGVDTACESDLKQVRLALRLSGIFKVSKQAQEALFDEIERSLHEELNYNLEAHNLEVFRAFHAQLDSKIIIPKPLLTYSSRRVLTLAEEMGDSIEIAATYPQETRNEIARRLFNMVSQQIFKLNCFHCDPHPGNFAFRADGTVVVYDFGGIKELTPEIVNAYKKTTQAGMQENIARLEEGLVALGIRNHVGQIPAAFYIDWCRVLLQPMTSDFDFSSSKVHVQTVEMAKQSFQYLANFQPSAYTLMLNRVLSGHYWNFVSLKVHDDFSDLTNLYING